MAKVEEALEDACILCDTTRSQSNSLHQIADLKAIQLIVTLV